MAKLKLDRPLIFFDLETTGTNVMRDRIVEISIIKVYPSGEEEAKTRRLNPEIPIPAEASAVHHITDEDVANEPTFGRVAKSLLEIFDGCDIAGFNSNRFDLPLLIQEFDRANLKFDLKGRRLIDVQTIFHKMEQRTLVAAYKFYCGKNLEDAHSALADTRATYEVLLGQLDRYDSLSNDVDFLADFSRPNKALDLSARIVENEKGEPVFNFGQNKGRTVKEVIKTDPGFINWMLNNDFPKNTKDVLRGLHYKYTHPKPEAKK